MLKTIFLSVLLYIHSAESQIDFHENGSYSTERQPGSNTDPKDSTVNQTIELRRVNSNTTESKSSLEISSCLKNQTYFEETETCVGILLRGPCPEGQWVVVSESTEAGECKPHPQECEDEEEEKSEACVEAVLELQNGLYSNQRVECNSTVMRAVFTEYGSVICVCKPGLVYSKTWDWCYEPYEQGPCTDGQYLNIVISKRKALQTSSLDITEAERNRIMDEKDTVLSYLGSRILTTVKPATSTSVRRNRQLTDDIPNFQGRRRRQVFDNEIKTKKTKMKTTRSKTKRKDATTTTASTTTSTTPNPRINPSVRFIDEMDNTGLSYIGSHKSVLSTGNNLTEEENYHEDELETFEHELVCTANPCEKDYFPLNISLLRDSPNANIGLNDTIQFQGQEDENTMVCESIGSDNYCMAGFSLGVNEETLALDCVENEVIERSAYNSVPVFKCGQSCRPRKTLG